MMDQGETSFLVTKITLPDVTEMEDTSTATTSVDMSGGEVTHHDGRGPGMPQEPTQKNDRMRLWNQSDIGWNMRNQEGDEDYGEDYDEDYEADDEAEDDTPWQFWEVIYTEGPPISSSLQCEPSPKIPSCDVPRPTIELKHRTSGMSGYKTVKRWRTIWDVQWFELTDTAWSGHAQPPGRIVYPQRFEDAE